MRKLILFVSALSLLLSVNASAYAQANSPAPNEIWYTSADGQVVELSDTEGLENTVVSNTYENGKGIILLDGELTTIGEFALAYLSGFTSITIPNSVNTIKAFAFGFCEGLTSITIPESVREIEISAFWGCENLKSAYCKSTTPPTYVIVEDWLDGDEGDYPSVFSPSNTEEFKLYIPHNCIGAYMADEEWNKLASNFVLYDFAKGEVCIPKPAKNEIWYTNGSRYNSSISEDSYSNYGIVSEEYSSWLECWVVTFSSTVTSVEDMLSKTGIRSVILPESVTEIGVDAFAYCHKLTTITIPNSVTTINLTAFGHCSSLEEVILGKGVKHIVSGAFFDCESLKRVYCNIATPPQATVLTVNSLWCAFDDCSQDLKIYVPRKKVQTYKATRGWKNYAANIVGHDF